MEKFEVVSWVIHSPSEGGWWNDETGWVFCVKQATVLNHTEAILPVSSGNDARYEPFCYE